MGTSIASKCFSPGAPISHCFKRELDFVMGPKKYPSPKKRKEKKKPSGAPGAQTTSRPAKHTSVNQEKELHTAPVTSTASASTNEPKKKSLDGQGLPQTL
ncbi:unnamed protein product, partial [Mesorhabditis spiculigera]